MSIDCKSEEGIIIGLADSIMTLSSLLKEKLEDYPDIPLPKEILDALDDLYCDKDLGFILDMVFKWKQEH